MKLSLPTKSLWCAAAICTAFLFVSPSFAQLGQRFPSERKVVPDPVTGVPLIFLTSQGGDSKIYPTHAQWTSDGQWLIIRPNSRRVAGEAVAVNEETGDQVQITEGGFMGMLTIAKKSMKLYIMRDPARPPGTATPGGGRGGPRGDLEIVEMDLARIFTDSAAGRMGAKRNYERVVGKVPASLGAGGDMALDANEDVIYFRTGREYAAQHLPPGTEIASVFGPRNMGAGPSAVAKMNLSNGRIDHVVSVPFQMGHLQTNPWVPGELVFCWETGGNAPTRMWTVMADGTGLRPVYREPQTDWVTHEAVITKDEVAFAIMGHRRPGVDDEWGIAGTREFPTGLAIVNLRTNEMRIAGQTKSGSGLWHVHGSSDGRWAVGDDFSRSIYLIDRTNDEMILLSTGHKSSAQDHPHPTFSADGKKIHIQSAMLAEDDRAMSHVIIRIPDHLLNRTYSERLVR